MHRLHIAMRPRLAVAALILERSSTRTLRQADQAPPGRAAVVARARRRPPPPGAAGTGVARSCAPRAPGL